jgi:hypothetical protein
MKDTYYEEQEHVNCSFCNEDIHPNYHSSITHRFGCFQCLGRIPEEVIILSDELTNYTGD